MVTEAVAVTNSGARLAGLDDGFTVPPAVSVEGFGAGAALGSNGCPACGRGGAWGGASATTNAYAPPPFSVAVIALVPLPGNNCTTSHCRVFSLSRTKVAVSPMPTGPEGFNEAVAA